MNCQRFSSRPCGWLYALPVSTDGRLISGMPAVLQPSVLFHVDWRPHWTRSSFSARDESTVVWLPTTSCTSALLLVPRSRVARPLLPPMPLPVDLFLSAR